MPKFKRSRDFVPKYLKIGNAAVKTEQYRALSKAKKNIYRQASLALLTIILTVVIIFAMTAAWYTNIVQTSGLVFQAESWGFQGEIEIPEDPITAAPGDDGLVHLVVENEGDSIAAISVNVSKSTMSEEMQQRLFFYVDSQMTRNEETMSRVYLNSREGYTYTVFNDSSLTLTEERHNDAQLKWHWVYDVLGYYVRGKYETIEVSEDGKVTTTSRMTVEEYLRPIEYDYDKATTTVETDANGNLEVKLKTVDGTLTPEEYIWNQSFFDGYKGVIDPQLRNAEGYYPVEVDADGYGVYAYLCNYAEIEMATKYDTQLGQLAYDIEQGKAEEGAEEDITYIATLTISAQKNENITETVSTLAALKEALLADTADVIQLNSDITVTNTDNLVIPANSRVILDLNGHTIKTAVSDPAVSTDLAAVDVRSGSTLTMMNGTIEGSEAVKYGIYATGAEVMLSHVDVKNSAYGVYIGDSSNNNSLDSRVYMKDCTINGESVAVFIAGNGTASEQKSQLVIEKCILTSNGIVISGNGTTTGNGRWGTDIQISDSQIISNPEGTPDIIGAGIYLPQKDSETTIVNTDVIGYTGIALKSGSLSITDSRITGNGATAYEPYFGDSGFADTAAAVYIETNYGHEILLEISGVTVLNSTYGKSLQVYEENAPNVAVIIHSGQFKEEVPEAYLAPGSVRSESGNVVTAAS